MHWKAKENEKKKITMCQLVVAMKLTEKGTKKVGKQMRRVN